MLLSKKITFRLSKVIPCLNSSIEEFEFVTMSTFSQHQQGENQTLITVPQAQLLNNAPLPRPLQQDGSIRHDRRRKRPSSVCPEDELDLLRINGMLIEASKTWKQTHHRTKLMAFPSKKYGDNATRH